MRKEPLIYVTQWIEHRLESGRWGKTQHHKEFKIRRLYEHKRATNLENQRFFKARVKKTMFYEFGTELVTRWTAVCPDGSRLVEVASFYPTDEQEDALRRGLSLYFTTTQGGNEHE